MDEPQDNGSTKKADADLLKTALDRFKLAEEAEKKLREDCLDDLKFLSGEQWPDKIRVQREQEGKPCLTINRLPQFLRQVTNAQRQNRVAAKVSPVDDAGDIKTAEVIQGLIRNIEYASKADIADDTMAFNAAAIGFGYEIILPRYCDPDSFEQEIYIERVRNPFSIYLDPNAQEPDGSDASWGFKFTTLKKDDYKAEYPGTELASLDDWKSVGDRDPGWLSEDSVRIAEYFYKETTDDVVVQLPDGTTALKSKMPTKVYEQAKAKGFKERPTKIPVIKWCKHNAIEVLESTTLPGSGKWLPIVRALGDELEVDGELKFQGVIRHAKDSQRMYNYWATKETEAIALAPNAPWIMAEGQEEGHEAEFQTANVKNPAFLLYKPKNVDGQLAPPPQRNVQEPPIRAITEARMQAADDLKATTGIYDAALGAKSNEQTGKAILARQQQGDISNFHFIDNMARAISQRCRLIVDWIPFIYDTARIVRIIGEDDTHKTVMVNKENPDVNEGFQGVFDLKAGKYDVICAAGPSFATKRQQAAEMIAQLAQAFPPIMQVAGDLLIKSMDIPYALEIAERLKKTLPPQLRDNDPNQEIPPQVQQQIQQMQQEHQALNAYAQQVEQENKDLKSGAAVKQAQIESNERIEMARLELERVTKVEVPIAVAEITSKAQNERERMKLEMDLNNKLLIQNDAQAHEVAMASADAGHEALMASQAHRQAQELAAQQPDDSGASAE